MTNTHISYLAASRNQQSPVLMEQPLDTAREYNNRQMFQDSLRRTANLWWTQTAQYGISAVDEAVIQGFKDKGVKEVRWIAADDEKTCPTCGERDNKVYRLNKIPPKPHYGCRCHIVPVRSGE